MAKKLQTNWIIAGNPADYAEPKHRKDNRVDYDIEKTSRNQRIRIRTVAQWTGYTPGYIHNLLRKGKFPAHLEKKTPTAHLEWLAGVIMDFIEAGHRMPQAEG